MNTIRRSRAFGRLTLRNTTQIGIAHLYFRGGRLVYIVSNHGEADATLADLRHWTQAIVRFERDIATSSQNVSDTHERLLNEWMMHLQRRNLTVASPTNSPHVIESHLVATPKADQLITPQEWYLLVEGIRRVSVAVAHLVGPREALNVLRDILEDFSSAFPALSCLQLAPSGYLQVVRTAQLDRIPRLQVIDGFAALIATCRYFCSPIIGEVDTRKLFIQALNDIGPALASLGVLNA